MRPMLGNGGNFHSFSIHLTRRVMLGRDDKPSSLRRLIARTSATGRRLRFLAMAQPSLRLESSASTRAALSSVDLDHPRKIVAQALRALFDFPLPARIPTPMSRI
jgi:hypothetical protein